MNHTFLNKSLEYNVTYKKRKTLSININAYGQVTVEAPRGTEEKVIIQLLENNWEWLLDKVNERKLRLNGSYEKVYDDGEKFLYLGKSYPIIISEDTTLTKDKVTFENNQLYIYVKTLEEDRMKQALKRFYYQKCKALVEGRIRFYQKNFKEKPRGIRIVDDSTTWGTCNSKYELTFNWKLAMAPMEVIDYVVVHEMCHMVHLNHDRSFWRLVGKIIPNYEERQNWLALSSWKMVV